MKFNPSTPVKFYAKETTYIPGQGQTETWKDLGILYGEWRGSFGDRAMSAEALGVKDSATVRTFYHPDIYAKLKTEQIIIAKNGTDVFKDNNPDKSNTDCYELWGGVDNVLEENQYMEFRVRRYEGL